MFTLLLHFMEPRIWMAAASLNTLLLFMTGFWRRHDSQATAGPKAAESGLGVWDTQASGVSGATIGFARGGG